MTKICTQCEVEKPMEGYYRKANRKHYASECKECAKEYSREYRKTEKAKLQHRISNKKYYEKNKDIIQKKTREKRREYYKQNTEICKEQTRRYRRANKEKIYLVTKRYKERNRSKYVEYERRRIQNNPNARLALNLRTRLNRAISIEQKRGSAVRDLGCTIEYLREYLAQLFRDDMSWNNYGPVWEIDHIVPLSFFDLTDRDQFLKACHYTNLQPLYKEENRRKSGKYIGAR